MTNQKIASLLQKKLESLTLPSLATSEHTQTNIYKKSTNLQITTVNPLPLTVPKITPVNHLPHLTDLELYQLCQQYGSATLQARRQFLGLLPEVQKRRLYSQKGFTSIFEFAAKLAGISEEMVRTTINLERRFQDKPQLHSALTKGQISINKLAKIVSIATVENQSDLFNLSQNLSTRALETLVRDEKAALFHKQLTPENLHVNSNQTNIASAKILNLQISSETLNKLLDLQNKGINIDQIINQALEQRSAEIQAKKVELANEQDTKSSNYESFKNQKPNNQTQKNHLKNRNIPSSTKHPSRHIPNKIKRLIQAEQGTKCSLPTCKKPAKTIHHTQRFALTHSHSPFFLTQLCHQHHEIAHKIDLKYGQHSKTNSKYIAKSYTQ